MSKSNTKYWTGVGSRETPAVILDLMQEIAFKLACDGYVLRSGGADGADLAFQKGWERGKRLTPAEIFIPWDGFNGFSHGQYGVVYTLNKMTNSQQAERIASEIHPVWDRLSRGAKALHTRNIYQVLGKALNKPSDFLICYAQPTKTGVKGGTNTAVQIALQHNVPVFNLWNRDVVERFEKYVQNGS